MPVEFLMQQMEWREALEEAKQAKDAMVLEEMERRMQNETRILLNNSPSTSMILAITMRLPV